MSTVLLIIGKDLRRLWALALLGFLFSFVSTLGWYWDLFPKSSGFLTFIFSQVSPVVVLFFLSVGIVQSDPTIGDRAFWRTRPISPGALLCAKLLTLVLVFGVPSLLLNAYLALSMDAPSRVAVGMLTESTGMLLMESLLFALLGALTRSLMQAAAASLAFVLVVATSAALIPLPFLFTPWRMDIPGHAARMAAVGLYSGLAALGLLVHLFASRRLGRTLGLGAIFLPAVLFSASRWPVSIGAEAPESASPAKAGTAADVQVLLARPAFAWSNGYMNDPASGTVVRSQAVAINAAIRSIPPGRIVQIASISSVLRFADGRQLAFERIGREFWPNWSSFAQASAVCAELGLPPPVPPSQPDKQPRLRLFSVIDQTAGAFAGRRGTLTATLKIYELQFRELARMAAAKGSKWTHRGQKWRIRDIAVSEGKVVASLQHLRATSVLLNEGPSHPDERSDQYRYAVALVNRARGEFALGYHVWDSFDAPQWSIDLTTRKADFTEFWMIGGSRAPAPTDAGWLAGAELVVLEAEPAGSYDKDVVLADFEIPQVADHAEAEPPAYWQ